MGFMLGKYMINFDFNFLVNGFGLGFHVELPHVAYLQFEGNKSPEGVPFPFDLVLTIGPLQFSITVINLEQEIQ